MKLGQVVLHYGAVLIGTYLLFAYGTNSGTIIDKATAGSATVVKAFQGR